MDDQRSRAFELLTQEADTFIDTLKSLRSLKEVALTAVSSLDEGGPLRGVLDQHLAQIESAKRDAFRATLTESLPFLLAIANRAARVSQSSDDSTGEDGSEVDPMDLLPDEIRQAIEPELSDARGRDAQLSDFKMVSVSGGGYRIEIEDPAIAWHFWAVVRDLRRGAGGPTHAALLMRSILTMAVSAFEVLIGNLHRTFLICNPSAAENPEVKAFSLSDLYDFGSVQDAIDESIFRQSDSFSRKGLRSWAKWFEGRSLSIDMATLAFDWDRTHELFERRNITVHGGSRVTRQYLNNVAKELVTDLSEGMPLEVSPTYVEESIERLMTLGILLAYKVRLKLFRKEDEDAYSWIRDEQFELLTGELFCAAHWVSVCAGDEEMPDNDRMLLRVNGWIAQMRTDGISSCRSEVSAWDTSALTGAYKAAKLVLLGDEVRALPAIRELVERDELTLENLVEWPLFHWFRRKNLLDDLINEMRERLDQQTIEVVEGP